MAYNIDLGGADLIVNTLSINATTPGATGTNVKKTTVGGNVGATKTVATTDSGKTFLFDQTAGSVVTLPAATGSGNHYRFVVNVLATSNSHIIYTDGGNSGAGAGLFKGIIVGTRVDSGNAVLGFAANGTTHDTITLNRTTTGSVTLGEWIDVTDVAANTWNVSGVLSATGAAFASPFSAT